MTLEPIGIFHAESKYPYEARRQAAADLTGSHGEIRLIEHRGFEQALEDLEGFERVWLVYRFHQNPDWKPKVMPPRGPRVKRGVFATRAPYRPNALGLSCVRLLKVEGLSVLVEGHDLLDGTPVFDIKPYIPYADAFPEAKVGWLEDIEQARWQIHIAEKADAQFEWLEQNGVSQIRGFVQGQLEFEPLDHKRKRVEIYNGAARLCYRTWRVDFKVDAGTKLVTVDSIRSGYLPEELASAEDKYGDKDLHRRFVRTF